MPHTNHSRTTRPSGKLADATLAAIDGLEAQWAAVERARRSAGIDADSVPANAFTIKDYMDKFGLYIESTARNQLMTMVRSGFLQDGKKPALRSDGKMISMRCYWPKESNSR